MWFKWFLMVFFSIKTLFHVMRGSYKFASCDEPAQKLGALFVHLCLAILNLFVAIMAAYYVH